MYFHIQCCEGREEVLRALVGGDKSQLNGIEKWGMYEILIQNFKY